MPGSLHLTKQRLSFAKLVATPTETSWAQAYNAGNLFAALSLTQKPDNSPESLPVLGKSIFSNLEAEFFTLEKKTLESVKKALRTSIQKIPPDIQLSFCLCFFKEDLLYLFIAGSGKILIKREDAIGVLLEQYAAREKTIQTASGYVQNNDCFILQTEHFATSIKEETLATAMDVTLPNDIAETLSPHLHKHEDGGQAAIIVTVHGITRPEEPSQEADPDDPTIATAIHEELLQEKAPFTPEHRKLFKLPHIPLPKLPTSIPFNRKTIFLILAGVLLVALIGSISVTKYQQEQQKRQTFFRDITAKAQKQYEEGKALQTLNPELSRESLEKAAALIEEKKAAFPEGSKETKALASLLEKIRGEQQEDTGTPEVSGLSAKEVSDDVSPLLALEKKTSAISFAQNNTTVFALTKEAVLAITKANGQKKTLIENEDTWTNAVAIAPYQTNIYILDTKAGVLKFVPAGGGYGKTAYFKDETPDMKNAVSMAIDSAIWILTKDGKILKYTSGVADEFRVSGLQKPFAYPTKIKTSPELTRLYILDPGNSRIVVLSKEGTFIKEYVANVLRQVKDIDVFEKEKKIIVLAKEKLWEISLE